VLLRGAMDGLEAVPPYGDPGLARLRGPLALAEPGQPRGALDLGGQFGLHPALTRLHGFFLGGEALILHAVAGPWRSRSHFVAQDLLETGGTARLPDGWLNRALIHMPAPGPMHAGIGVGQRMPLLMQGAAPAGAYSSNQLPRMGSATLAALTAWHAQDPMLGPALAEGLRGRGYAAQVMGAALPPGGAGFVGLARAAGRLLAAADGPRVAALELDGWDTHAGQANRMAGPLRQLDEGLAALRDGLGAHWSRTAVLVLTEFGRTARMNAADGTDHGTAGAVFLLGGAIRGGRVIADWPGLAEEKLFENRDLAATLDSRRIAKALLAGHLGLSVEAVAAAFPGSADAPPLPGLLR
jgi:uncharacterized protein (DUF1501 family)